MNCLNQAIAEERIHQVRLLLSMDVDCEMKDKNDCERTPLIKSCLVKNEEPSLKLLKILLKFGVSINAVDKLGRSPLHYSCATGKSEVTKVLMNEDGIELNTQDHEGRTPLMLACAEGHLVMSRVLMGKLVKFDLEIDVRDNQGYTALLLAIKNEHYDVAHDLVRYANACTTLRDNELFMNAAEWLKSNLEKRRKTKHESEDGQKDTSGRRRHGAKTPKTEKTQEEEEKERAEQNDEVPILTLTEYQDNETDEFGREDDSTTRVRPATSAAAAGILFEPDPYRTYIRPPSSGQESYARPPSSGQESHARPPSTGASRASSVGTARFSASSRNRQMRKMEQLKEEQNLSLTPPTTPVQNPVIDALKREAGAESVSSFATSRGSRRNWRGDDLESIVEDPLSRQPSREGGRESILRSQSQQDTRNAARTPVSFRSKSPYNQTARKSRSEKLKQEKSSEIYAIQKLKQALRDKTRRKITRASTAVFRPASGTPSEQWMSAIIKGGKRGTVTSKSAYVIQKSNDVTRPSGQRTARSNYSVNTETSSVSSAGGSRKLSVSQIKDTTSPAMRLLHAASNLSLDTLLSQSDITNSTAMFPETNTLRNVKGTCQLKTLFRLYTDSCLWKPVTLKPASLSVQINSDKSDRMTLISEISESTNDGAALERLESYAGSTTGSIPPKVRPESKTTLRNRIPGSATSRASMRSKNAGSAGGRSVTSRHAD